MATKYLDDSMPWRFDPESRWKLDDDDCTVMDFWKVARRIHPEAPSFFSLGLRQTPLNEQTLQLEDIENHYGEFYSKYQKTFAVHFTVGLFCFAEREVAVEFAQSIARKRFVTRWPNDPLMILRGKGILPELIKPPKIMRDMTDRKMRLFYDRHYFNKDMCRWRRWNKEYDEEDFEKRRLTTKWLGLTTLFAGFRVDDFEPVPENTWDTPDIRKMLDYPPAPEGFDPDDPKYDFLNGPVNKSKF
jgi:hypothetical protein